MDGDGVVDVERDRHGAPRLEHGDLLVMSGGAQEYYEHSVPKTSRPVGPRLNLTFRWVHDLT